MKNLIKVNTFTSEQVVGADGKSYSLDYNGFMILLFNTSRNAYIQADADGRTAIIIISSR